MTSVVVDVTPIPTREIVFERQRTDTPTPGRRTFEKPDRVIELPDQVDIPIRVDPTKVDNPIQLKADTGLPKDIGGGMTFGRDTQAVPLVRIPPEYPQRAANQGLEGWVKVRFTITEIGGVEDAIIVESSASVFESSALKAIVRWRYNPEVVNGQAVERGGVETLLRFTLQ